MPPKQINEFDAVTTAALADLLLTQQDADSVARKLTLTQIKNLFASAYAQTLWDDADASTALSTLGFTAFAKTLIDDADAATARTTLAAAGLGVNVFTGTQSLDKGADIASANALTLGADGNYFDVTGTTAITSIVTVGVGTVVTLHFDAALTLTHHATDLILPGSANITTAAGDEFTFVEYATGDWRCIGYALASGQAIAPTTELSLDATPQLGGALDGQNNAVTNIASLEIDDAAPATPTAQTLYEDSIIKMHCKVGINGSFFDDVNGSSATDTGTGVVTVNFATTFGQSDYSAVSGILDTVGDKTVRLSSQAATSIVHTVEVSGVDTDPSNAHFIIATGNN